MTDVETHDIMAVEVGPDDPAEDVPVETLRSGLKSDESTVRMHAVNVASFVPREQIETLKAVREELFDLLEDEYGVVVYQATIALSLIAEDEPALVEPAIPRIVELLDGDHTTAATIAAQILGYVALEHPEMLIGEVDRLLARTAQPTRAIVDEETVAEQDRDRTEENPLKHVNYEGQSRQRRTRDITANLLVEVAEHDPTVLLDHVDTIVDILEDDDVVVVTAMADVVSALAREDRSAVTPAVDPLVSHLDRADDTLVATVVTALGFVGDPAAIEDLRALSNDEDRPEDLRDLAAETADFIEDAHAQ